MAYVDAQDLAAKRQRKADAEATERSAERAAEIRDRDERGRALFKSEQRCYLDQLVQADLNAAQGYVGPHELKAAQEEAWAQLEPIINEVPGRPLSVDAVKAIVAGVRRGPVSGERVGELIDMIVETRSKVYQTKASRTAELSAMNAEVAKERPKLNALLRATGAGNSVPLAREMLAESADRSAASARSATAAKPFDGRLQAPTPTVTTDPGTLWPLRVVKR